jgi:hypothetical protein
VLTSKGLDDQIVHSRDVYVYVLLLRQRRAGVYSGVDSEAGILNPDDPPAEWRGGFLIFSGQIPMACLYGALSIVFQAPVAKWLTRRSAKPVYAGSIPARRSKYQLQTR